jgi:putative ABC transport system ATP-binding protein
VLLQVQNLRKTYVRGQQQVHALNGVSFTLKGGEFVSVMGPSGSGKSTLLHMLGGLDRLTSGSVIIGNENIANFSDEQLSLFRRQKLGFIFQFFNLLPTLTALENVALPLLLDGKSLKSVSAKATDLLKLIGLEERITHRPDELSGGEMQRVAIARALVTDPLLILADEPTGNLDSKNGKIVLELLSLMAKERGHTILMVTHDLKAACYGTRLIKMRDGLIEDDGVPEKLAQEIRA